MPLPPRICWHVPRWKESRTVRPGKRLLRQNFCPPSIFSTFITTGLNVQLLVVLEAGFWGTLHLLNTPRRDLAGQNLARSPTMPESTPDTSTWRCSGRCGLRELDGAGRAAQASGVAFAACRLSACGLARRRRLLEQLACELLQSGRHGAWGRERAAFAVCRTACAGHVWGRMGLNDFEP